MNQLICDIQRNPFTGLGKPEPLKYGFSGTWSRRITDEHRRVYGIEDDMLVILPCRFHDRAKFTGYSGAVAEAVRALESWNRPS